MTGTFFAWITLRRLTLLAAPTSRPPRDDPHRHRRRRGPVLPGQLLSAVGSDGTPAVTLTAALVTVGRYLLVSSVAAAASFVRRDVTACHGAAP